MNPIELGALSLLGAVLGLDVVSFPQAMLSRPLVSATLTGALLGTPGCGILLGVTLECFALETLPVGASRYPEWGSSSVVGGVLVASAPPGDIGTLVLAVIASLSWAWVGGWSMVQLRRLNARWAKQRHEAVARGSRRTIDGLQLYGMSADLVRGWLMTAVGITLFTPVMRFARSQWSAGDTVTGALLMTLAGTVAFGAVHKVFHAFPGTRWLLGAGVAIGALLLAVGG